MPLVETNEVFGARRAGGASEPTLTGGEFRPTELIMPTFTPPAKNQKGISDDRGLLGGQGPPSRLSS